MGYQLPFFHFNHIAGQGGVESVSVVRILVIAHIVAYFSTEIIEMHVHGTIAVRVSAIEHSAAAPRRNVDARHLAIGGGINRGSDFAVGAKVEAGMEVSGTYFGQRAC